LLLKSAQVEMYSRTFVHLFAVKHSCLWDRQTGEDEIRKLLTDYGVVKESNILLNVMAHSRSEAFKEWRERLKFIGVSCEALQAKFPMLLLKSLIHF
jgi:hypothetical protein